VVAIASCSDDAGSAGTGGAAPTVTELTPDAAPLPGETECKVTITEGLPIEGSKHEDVCTSVEYGTNPPSSGNHWPIWAAFRAFDAPVPREMYVHDLEHGGIVMAYRCDAACPDVTDAFEAAATDFGVDERCLAAQNGAERSRLVVTPDPLLDRPIGLAAWGATYTATCIDPPSLLTFIQDHYATGPEDTCAQGKDPTDPTTGIPACSP
jgi:hypothetical protein